MPRLQRFYGENHLHFLTTSTYRRAPVFHSECLKRQFVTTLEAVRGELGFRMLGYVLMPEHFHLLVWLDKSPSLREIADTIVRVSAPPAEWMNKICELSPR